MDDDSFVQQNYNGNAHAYNQFILTPLGTLEQQLFDLSIRDCVGLKVLDLGGGTGLRARDALRAGAEYVDVVDISHEMMRHGKEETKYLAPGSINWYHGDATKSLDHLALGPYDMVIANGIFDHAHTVDELGAMWSNAAAYLKPGGRLVANRNIPLSQAAKNGKYGVTFTDFQDIPGGLIYKYRMSTEPPLVFESTALKSYYSGSLTIPGKFFQDFENVAWDQTPVVKANPDFWRAYLDDPILYIFTAKKRAWPGALTGHKHS